MGSGLTSANTRGAHGSKGRTSWTGKSELDDYTSFAAFFMHYLSHIRPFPVADPQSTPAQSPVSPRVQQSSGDVSGASSPSADTETPVLVLGGYSYGSLMVRNLPPVPSILQPFAAPADGSAASEILLRARKLADQSNAEWIHLARSPRSRQSTPKKSKSREKNLSVTMGGEETSPDIRRSSREFRHSLDGRKSLDLGRRVTSLSRASRKNKGKDGGLPKPPTGSSTRTASVAIRVPEIRYLLVSPLLPPLSAVIAPGLAHRFWGKAKDTGADVFAMYPALVVFGNQDMFTSVKKVRQWAGQLQERAGEAFSYVEIDGAGHFWHEHGVEKRLRDSLRTWNGGSRETNST